MILMLLTLYPVPGIAGFFAGLGTTIDAVLTTLVGGQFTLLQATGQRITALLLARGTRLAL